MKKLIALALTLIVVAAMFCSCGAADTEESPATPNLPSRFVILDEDLNDYTPGFDTVSPHVINVTYCYYVVDRYSRAVYMYMYDWGDSSGLDFIPLYTPEGTVLIYEGELPE